MRKHLLIAVYIYTIPAAAQNNTGSDLIEGGKTLIELVKVFKTPKSNVVGRVLPTLQKTDSCSVKNTSERKIRGRKFKINPKADIKILERCLKELAYAKNNIPE